MLMRDITGGKLFTTIRVGVNPTRSSAAAPPARRPAGLPPPLRIAASARQLRAPRRPPGHPALGAVPGAAASAHAAPSVSSDNQHPRRRRRRYRASGRASEREAACRTAPLARRPARGWSSVARAFAEPGALLPHLIHASG